MPKRKLTPREIQVVQLIWKGLKTQEIAKQLRLSPKTISAHRVNVFYKLNAANTATMLRIALRRKLIKR
jgi:DNA-binding NarL/FixJ family response regulator